ncbi:MAG: dTMP kinase [Candidatus Magasanikbacteria bacterium]
MNKGLFIMLEGTDGSGKSTQTNLLVERLKQERQQVEQISFPQYGKPSAALVEDYLNGKFGSAEEVGPYRASILYAVDRFAASEQIKKWLSENKIVIANRYVASNMGHQGGKIKNPAERQKYFDWNYDLEYTILGIPKPEVNIILHVTPDISQQLVDKKGDREYLKGKKRDIHEDDLHHLADAEQAYLDIAKHYPEFTLIECVQNNNMLPPDIIHKKIWSEIKKHLNS